MQKKQIKRPYLAPELTVVDFRVERGLTGSLTPEEIQLTIQSEMLGMGLMEQYAQQNNGRGFEGFQTATGGNGGYFGDGINAGSEYWF